MDGRTLKPDIKKFPRHINLFNDTIIIFGKDMRDKNLWLFVALRGGGGRQKIFVDFAAN